MRRNAILSHRPTVPPAVPAASLDGANLFARFAYSNPEQSPESKPANRAPIASKASKAFDQANIPEGDEDGWIDCSASGKVSNFERARNIQKAILAKRRRECYQQHKERIKKRLKQESELEEDGVGDGDGDNGGRGYDDVISPAVPARLQPLPAPSLASSRQINVKSTLIRNTLLERSLDDYDPLADQLARSRPKGRVSVYERMGEVDSVLPRKDMRPFTSPVRHAPAPTKVVSNPPESFYNRNTTSVDAAPKPRDEEMRVKRRVVVFSDDDTDMEPSRAATLPPANPVASSKTNKASAIIDLSDDLEDTPVRERPNGLNGWKKVAPSAQVGKMAPLVKNGAERKENSHIAKKKETGRGRRNRGDESSIDEAGTSDSESNDEDDIEEVLSENDEDDGEGEEAESVLQRKAKAIIRQCEDVSARLQEAILSWDTSKSTDRDCVNLTSMASTGSKQILTAEDIASICPGLSLNPYQVVGVNWLKLLLENDVNGVLADDMGLGKTVQTIAFLSWLLARSGRTPAGGRVSDHVAEDSIEEIDDKEVGGEVEVDENEEEEHDDDEEEEDGEGEDEEEEDEDEDEEEHAPHLIVVPASTLNNWKNEIEKFNPNISFFIYHGSQSQRQELRHELRRSIQYGEVDVILTTYTLFERETNKPDRSFLCSLRFNYLILDEAHCIKNSDSLRYANLNALQTQHRLLLSGTPVQNNLSELLALLSFLMPTVFRADKCQLLIQAFGWTHSTRDKSSAGQHKERQVGQLKGMLAPFVLRRLKVDVLDQLSTKQTQLCKLAMTPRQQVLYDQILTSYARKTANMVASTSVVVPKGGGGHASSVVPTSKGSLASSPPPATLTSEEWNDITREAGKKLSDIPASPSPSSHGTVYRVGSYLGSPAKPLGHCPSTPTHVDLTDSRSSDVRRPSTPSPSHGFRSMLEKTQAEAKSMFEDEEASFSVLEGGGASSALPTMTATEAKHLFTTLRKAANHPLLLRIYYQDDAVLEEIAKVAHVHGYFGGQCTRQRVLTEIKTFSDFDLHQLCTQYPALQKYELTADTLYDSPKMLYLREHLPRLAEDGHRMLVFSQWTRILDLLEVFLEDMGMAYLRLDGSTAVQARQELIDTFNSDTSIPVFLLSTKAGGLGINLTAADTVILHDLDFNPENDKQAEDRCHRIGQTKPVTVYKLVAGQSVDEDIYEMGERKSRMSRAVLSGGGAASSATASGETKQRRGRKDGEAGEGEEEADGDGGGDDIAVISKILSKALLKYSSSKALE